MKRLSIGFLAAAAILSTGTCFGAEYIYRDLMGNTLPTPNCSEKPAAIEQISQPYYINRYTTRFCEIQGYGWGLEQVKDNGRSVCEECGSGNQAGFQCHLEDVVVTCKRLKPGSVGLIPGQG